jgi:hypothetical protein
MQRYEKKIFWIRKNLLKIIFDPGSENSGTESKDEKTGCVTDAECYFMLNSNEMMNKNVFG